MNEIGLDDLKRIQLDILSFVDSFCREHDIHYWIDCGSLLGAIRHKGYIPWDDDIDIGMLREDYDRFMSEFLDLTGRYVFKCQEKDPGFLYSAGKVLDTKTVLYEPDKNGYKLSVNIDVFVYDVVVHDEELIKKMYDKRDFLRRLHQQRNASYRIQGNVFKAVLGYLGRMILHIFPRNYFVKRMLENSKSSIGRFSEYVGNFTSYSRIVCRREWVETAKRGPFENMEVNIPIGYDQWLKSFYGDYMKLPPKEKQVTHHTFEAYYL